MVGDSLSLLHGRFCRSDIQVPVKLLGVGIDDLTVDSQGRVESDIAFPNARGAEDDDEFRLQSNYRGEPGKRPRRSFQRTIQPPSRSLEHPLELFRRNFEQNGATVRTLRRKVDPIEAFQ